jgi:adenosylmethionine-8-amino-7-oxononanoate aminotransferase
VGEIRGKGLMVIIELVADRGSKTKFDPALNIGGKLTAATRERGLIVRANNDGIAFAPPLSISADEIDTVIASTADAVRAVLG